MSEEVILANSACVTDGDRIGIVLSLYVRNENGKSTFRGACAKWDTPEGWAWTERGLQNLEPAGKFTLSSLGMENGFSGLAVVDRGTTLLNFNAAKCFDRLLKRAKPLEEFEKRNETLSGSFRFELDFEGRGLSEIPDGWNVSHVKKKPRAKKKIIY